METQAENREREKRMFTAIQSGNTLTEAGKLARVEPGTCYSSLHFCAILSAPQKRPMINVLPIHITVDV